MVLTSLKVARFGFAATAALIVLNIYVRIFEKPLTVHARTSFSLELILIIRIIFVLNNATCLIILI